MLELKLLQIEKNAYELFVAVTEERVAYSACEFSGLENKTKRRNASVLHRTMQWLRL